MPNEQFFCYIMVRTRCISMRWWWCPLCTRSTLSWSFIVLVHWNNSPHVDISLHSDTLAWFLLNSVYSDEAAKPISVFGLPD